MIKNNVKDINDRLHSNLSPWNIDLFYKNASLDLLCLIVDYIENQKGIEINNDNAFTELIAFTEEFKKKEMTGYEIYNEMFSKYKTNALFSLAYMSETTLNKVYYFFNSLLIATKIDLEKEKSKDAWIKEFENEFQLEYFRKPEAESNEEKGVTYFENMKHTEWYVMIDQNSKVITTKKFTHDNFYDRGEKERKIVEFLLSKTENWDKIGLERTENRLFRIEKVVDRDYHIEFYYDEKETPNAFGNYDWSEF